MKLILFSALLVALSAVLFGQSPAPLAQSGTQSYGPDSANLPIMPVGMDDLISVQVYDAPEFTRTVRVNADGTIRIPMIQGKLKVDGMMPLEVETLIASALKKGGILVDPIISVSVAEYRSRPISVVGAVKMPVTFQALPGTTLLDALTRAQGLTDDAGTDIIVSKTAVGADGKPEAVNQRIPVKGLLDATNSIGNVPLTGGETVRVPEGPKIFVVGNVIKPGSISVHDTLGDTTVLKAVALSMGLSPYAAKVAYIYRREGASNPNQDGVPVELAKILDRKAPDVPLQANDILYIPQNNGQKMTAEAIKTLLGLGQAAMGPIIYTTR